MLVSVHAWVVATVWQTLAGWLLELELLAVLVLEGVGERIERKRTRLKSAHILQVNDGEYLPSEGHGHNEIWRCDERVGGRVGVVASSEVAVVGADDAIRLAALYICDVC